MSESYAQEPAEVVNINTLPQGFKARRRHKHPQYLQCRHSDRVLDEHRRIVECEQCGYVEEPFDYLWHIAMKHVAWRGEVRALQELVVALHEEHADLTRQVKNLKATHKRWTRKVEGGGA